MKKILTILLLFLLSSCHRFKTLEQVNKYCEVVSIETVNYVLEERRLCYKIVTWKTLDDREFEWEEWLVPCNSTIKDGDRAFKTIPR